MFMRILKWGYIPMSAFIIALGAYSDIRQASTWGVASWAWYLIGYVLLLAISLFIIISLSRDNRQLRKPLEEQSWNKLREVKIKQRQIYADRKQKLLDALLSMDRYLARLVDSQNINAEQVIEAFSRVYRKMLPKMFVGTFTIIGKNKKRFVNYNMKLTINMLAELNTALKEDYELGTLVALNKDEYRELDKQIRELENGLSLKIINDVNQVILYCQIVNCLRLINPDRSFWKRIQIRRLNQKALLAFRTMLSNSQWQIGNIMDNARGQVSEDFDKYLLGE